MRVQLKAPITKLCPFFDEIDVGRVVIEYEHGLSDRLLELHRVRRILDRVATLRISHEELTEQLARHLTTDEYDVYVTTYWYTAGIDVKVESP